MDDTFHKEGGEPSQHQQKQPRKDRNQDKKRLAKDKDNKMRRNKIMFINRPSEPSEQSSLAESRYSLYQTNSSASSKSYNTDNSYSSLNSEDRHFSDSLASDTKTEFFKSGMSLTKELREKNIGADLFKGQDTQATLLNQMIEKRSRMKYGDVKKNVSTKETVNS